MTENNEVRIKQMERLQAIKEINQAVRDALNQWADIALEADAKQWAEELDYFPRDLMNVTILFQHVISNIGIKSGHVTKENCFDFGHRLRQLIIDMTGYDPHTFWDNIGKETEEE